MIEERSGLRVITVFSLTTALLLSLAVLTGCASKEDLTEQGKLAHIAQRYDLAIFKFQEALDKDPNYVPAMYGLGLAYLSKKEPKKAIEQLEKVIKLDPKNKMAEEARFQLTKYFFSLGREAQAASKAQEAIKWFEKAASYECKKENAADQARNAIFEIKYKNWRPDFIKNQLDARLKAIEEWAGKYSKEKTKGKVPFEYDPGTYRFMIEGVGHEPADKSKMSQDDARVYTRQSAVDSYKERACALVYLIGGLEVPEKCKLEDMPKLSEENEFWDNNDYVIIASTSVEDLMRAFFKLHLSQKQKG
ncbi:MAG: tetratricopeptide repeat protein [Deltaproteobacteria bacterium]|nr:tetratricopeptide repeat protein [Deltaproteobacteria bacterium]